MCADGWFNLCRLIPQCATGVPPPQSDFNQTDSGQVRLHEPATHTPQYTVAVTSAYLYVGLYVLRIQTNTMVCSVPVLYLYFILYILLKMHALNM